MAWRGILSWLIGVAWRGMAWRGLAWRIFASGSRLFKFEIFLFPLSIFQQALACYSYEVVMAHLPSTLQFGTLVSTSASTRRHAHAPVRMCAHAPPPHIPQAFVTPLAPKHNRSFSPLSPEHLPPSHLALPCGCLPKTSSRSLASQRSACSQLLRCMQRSPV